jgi:hypothetical protein
MRGSARIELVLIQATHLRGSGAFAVQQGAAADRAIARSNRSVVVFGIGTWRSKPCREAGKEAQRPALRRRRGSRFGS